MYGVFRRSSPANERDIAEFMRRTGQTEECIFNHGQVTGENFAMSWLHKGVCPACKAAL